MLIAPCCVGRGRRFGERVLRPSEDHDECLLRVLGHQKQHLLAITRGEPSLGFQDQFIVIVEREVGQVVPLLLRLNVRELLVLTLVLECVALVGKGLVYFDF